jgi:hypothetical protein
MAVISKAAGNMALEVIANLVLPYLIYIRTETHLGPAHALMAASLPPILWSAIEFARNRRIDAMSALVVAGIFLSLLAFLGGGSVRVLQLREKLVTALIGLAFLVSLAIKRPLIYEIARAQKLRKSQSEAEAFEAMQIHPRFRRTMAVMTLVWGIGLLTEAALACLLVFKLRVSIYLVVSPILGYGTMGVLGLWTFWYGKEQQRRGAAARAAAKTL